MYHSGYSLVELLVVISMTAVLGIIGFVNYKSFSSDQIIIKSLGEVQTYLRLAQSNATSSTLCSDNTNTGPWSLVFNGQTVDLSCGPTNTVQKTYTLENAEVSQIRGISCGANSNLPFRITYTSVVGDVSFASAGSTVACLGSASWTFTLRNTVDTSQTKTFIMSSGGAINVQ